jgi:hypothetical protein
MKKKKKKKKKEKKEERTGGVHPHGEVRDPLPVGRGTHRSGRQVARLVFRSLSAQFHCMGNLDSKLVTMLREFHGDETPLTYDETLSSFSYS